MRLRSVVGSLVVGASLVSPVVAVAGDNFAFLEQAKQQGAYVRSLSVDEDRMVQGENWTLVYKLMKWNVRIYGRVGWELGRLISIRQYGIDPGPYPGLQKALSGRF